MDKIYILREAMSAHATHTTLLFLSPQTKRKGSIPQRSPKILLRSVSFSSLIEKSTFFVQHYITERRYLHPKYKSLNIRPLLLSSPPLTAISHRSPAPTHWGGRRKGCRAPFTCIICQLEGEEFFCVLAQHDECALLSSYSLSLSWPLEWPEKRPRNRFTCIIR